MRADPAKVIDIQTLADKLPKLSPNALMFIAGAAEMALTMSQAQMNMAVDLIVRQTNQQQ